jgi:hypothetical protein
MPGVDFVIKALFETSGARPGVDCAWEPRDETRIKRATLSKKLIGFTAPILLGGGESESVKRVDFNPPLPAGRAIVVSDAAELIF